MEKLILHIIATNKFDQILVSMLSRQTLFSKTGNKVMNIQLKSYIFNYKNHYS